MNDHYVRSILTCVAMIGCVEGCLVHVPLSAPDPNAPPTARMQAYGQLAPAAERTVTTVAVSGGTASVSSSTSMILRNGQTVNDPGDLLPVVQPDSATAQAARRADDAHSKARWSALGAVASLGVGLGLVLADGYRSPEYDMLGNTTREGGITPIGVIGLGIAVIGATVGGMAELIYSSQATQEQAAAFATYDDSLRARLRLCVNGLAVAPCE